MLRPFGIKMISALSILLLFHSNNSYSTTFDNTQKTSLQNQNNPTKHCVAKIEIKKNHLFMMDSWQKEAEQSSQKQWKDSVQARYGSVYSNWKDAINKKAECTRIGFGNDIKGNVGTSVICSFAAEPCVNLLNKENKR